ncbi:hypothetical protein RCL_jg28881.t1 [Rhizophagus clarus]|uniref:Uncharacterized protein n=1 Tax=Rhizophagus clarus TaxID=94130 RepID=A0A8H3LTI5_9GLOM|nr:hypothetical protein RCL_jg28881.t1 [Rhizophagus clarus]
MKLIEQQRNKNSKKTGCKWYINLKFEHAVVYDRCNAYTIQNLLQLLFPHQLFLTQDLSNAIQKIKCKHQIVGSDASSLLKFLLKKQKEDLTMFVQPLIDANSDQLCGIFWITSNQILLWWRYLT